MKIMIINSLYYPNIVGGAEKSVQILAETLVSKGHEPIVVSTADKNSTAWVNGVKVYYLKILNLYWLVKAKEQPRWKKPLWHTIDAANPFVVSPLSRIIESEKPELVQTNNLAGFSVQAWKVAKAFNLPVVHTIRDHYLLCLKSEMYNRGQRCPNQCAACRLFSLPKRAASSLVDGVTGVGKFILHEHLSRGYFAKARIRTHIYNPVDLQCNRPARNRHNGDVTFGYVGMLVPGKGIEFLLSRFADLHSTGATLKVFGRASSEEYETYLKQRYHKENISFEGRKDPDEIYSSIDVAVVPSLRHEAFGRIVPEANSFGKPVLVSNRGALPEIVHDGQNGFVFDPDQRGDLETKLNRLVTDPASIEKMASACLNAATEYDRDTIARRYVSLYEDVVR